MINLVLHPRSAGISVGGHLGGLVGGALAGLLIVFAERRARRPVELEALGVLALGAISVVGCFLAASAA